MNLEDNQLFPIVEKRRWGFIDASGAVVIPPQYAEARDFEHGRGPVRVEDRWGYVDAAGELVIEPRFDNALPFEDGRAAVVVCDKGEPPRRAWIDPAGDWIVGPLDPSPTDLEGAARYEREFVLEHGEALGLFVEDLAPAPSVADDGHRRFGFLDRQGRWGIEPEYSATMVFSEGLAEVITFPEQKDGVWGRGRIQFLDPSGRVAIDTRCTEVASLLRGFRQGRAVAYDPDARTGEQPYGARGWLDADGEMVIPPVFGHGTGFSEGLAVAGPDSAHQGFIDRDGATVITPMFWLALPFRHGLSRVAPDMRRPSTFGYIQPTGAWVWQPDKRFPKKYGPMAV